MVRLNRPRVARVSRRPDRNDGLSTVRLPSLLGERAGELLAAELLVVFAERATEPVALVLLVVLASPASRVSLVLEDAL